MTHCINCNGIQLHITTRGLDTIMVQMKLQFIL